MGSLSLSLLSLGVVCLVLCQGLAKPSTYEGNRYYQESVWQPYPRAQNTPLHERDEQQPQTNDLKCDCYVRLNVKTAQAEWFCGTTSDYECQFMSLRNLQGAVQTQAETDMWHEKRLMLLAQDASETAPCICSVKVGLVNEPTQYYCNGLSCYLLAEEMSAPPKAKLQNIALAPTPCPRAFDPSAPCCRCVRSRYVCSDAHCPVLPCANTYYAPGECCPMCPEDMIPQANEVIIQEDKCVEDRENKPCCRCFYGQLSCVDPVTFCGPAPCDNPVNVPGICCPTCQEPEQRVRCPYYHPIPQVIETQTQCGCDITCLKREQEACENIHLVMS